MALELVAAAVTLLALSLVALYKYLTSPFSYFEKQGVSGPKPAAFFGSWSGAWNKFLGDEDLKNVKEYGKVYGTFDGRTPNLIVSDPDLIKVVLVDQASNFKDHRASSVKNDFLHNALLAVSDSQPQEVKDVLDEISDDFFSKVSLHIVEAASDLSKTVRELPELSKAVEINHLAASFASDALARSIFGVTDTDGQFREACAAAFHVDHPKSLVAVIPFIYPKLSPLDEFILKKKALSYLTSKIQLALAEKKKAEAGEKKGTDVLDLLLKVSSEVTKVDDDVTEKVVRLSDQQIVSQTLGFILNSSLVTGKLVAAAVYALATKPEIQDKLHTELLKHVKGKSLYEGLEGAEFLDTLVGDLVRLYPSEFRLVRQCVSEVQLGNVKLVKGDLVSVPVYAVHRQDEYFPKADTLNPTRLSRSSTEELVDFTFLPFGQAGFQGKSLITQYGVLAAKLAIAELVKSFKFSASDDTKEQLEFERGVTGVPRLTPVTVSIEPRK